MAYPRTCLALLLAAACTGCGYQFIAGGPGPVIGGAEEDGRLQALRTRVPPLVVAPVENKSFEPDLEARFTELVQQEFAMGGGANVVTSAEAAGWRLSTTIESVDLPSLSFSQTGTFESRAIVTVSAMVEDLRTGRVVWRQRTSASSEFFITDDLQFNRVLQTRAVEQAGEQVAADLAASFLIHLESALEAQTPNGAPASGGPAALQP